MKQVSVQTLDSFSALRALAPGLDKPLADADFFCTLAWFETLAEHGMEPKPALRLAWVEDAQTGTSFCLPLADRQNALSGLSNYYSSLYGPIGDPQKLRPEALRTLCRHLRRAPMRWPLIELEPLDTDAPFCRDMLAALRAEGYRADVYFRFGNWYLDVAGRTFDAYSADLPAKLLNTIARGRKKLDREGDWYLTIQQGDDASLEAAIEAFETVYRRSWKQAEPHPGFIPGLCRMAAATGWLRLGIVTLHGVPIAAQLWLVKDGKASIYKLAYDQDYSRFSPGSVLSAALFRHAIDVDKVGEVDYLTGDDAYKRDWMSHRRERVGIVAFNIGTLSGLLGASKHFLGKSLKRLRQDHRQAAST